MDGSQVVQTDAGPIEVVAPDLEQLRAAWPPGVLEPNAIGRYTFLLEVEHAPLAVAQLRLEEPYVEGDDGRYTRCLRRVVRGLRVNWLRALGALAGAFPLWVGRLRMGWS